MILKALEQWLTMLLKFIDSCTLRGSYNAGYNRIILYQNQITILALDGKLHIKQHYETLMSICSEFTHFHCLKILTCSKMRSLIPHQSHCSYLLLM